MPFAIGGLIVSTFARQVHVVIGTYPAVGFVASFRAQSLGVDPSLVIVANADVDTSFTWFILVGAAAPAGSPPVGSKVLVKCSPLALFGGSPVASFPITQDGARGIVWTYATILGFPTVYGLVVEPDGNQVIGQTDELVAL